MMEEEKKKKTTNNKKQDVKKNAKSTSKKVDSKKKVSKKSNVRNNNVKTEKKITEVKKEVKPKVEEKVEVKKDSIKEKALEDTTILAVAKPVKNKEISASNESTRSKILIASLSILVFIMIILLIYKFNDRLKEDPRYKDSISEYCEQLAKKEEKQQRENVAKEVSSNDLDKIKFKKVTCEYNEPSKLSKEELKNNDAGYSYVISIKKDAKVAYTKEVLVIKSNDKWTVEEK
jgi:hypothetical protein